MTIKFNTFDYDLIENYFLKNISENDFWLFASDSSDEQDFTTKNAKSDARNFLEKTLFGIKYSIEDFAFMVPFIFWAPNTVYTQYDDSKILKGTNFYIVIRPENESGNYHIFKCISNNNSNISEEPPVFNSSIENGLYYLSDGYIWKYMTSVPGSLFRKFFARSLLPIVRNADVEAIASEGIYNIVVENRTENSGYERITGDVSAIDLQNGITRIFLKNLFSLTANEIPVFEVPNIYVNRAIYIEKSTSSPEISAIELRIRDSGVFNGLPFVSVSTPNDFNISVNDRIEILPRVVIEGNGSGASAISIFDNQNQRINSIRMLSFGEDYTAAVARIADPSGFDPLNVNRQDVQCMIRPILSPRGGHGYNVIEELHSNHIGLSKLISPQGEVPTAGFYRKIGVVKNPSFGVDSNTTFEDTTFDNRIEIDLVSIPGTINVGDEITQGDNVRGKVHEIDSSSNTLFIAEYNGPYDDIFVSNEPIRFQNVNYDINSIKYSPYVERTGSVLVVIDITPIERTPDNSEQIKIILDF